MPVTNPVVELIVAIEGLDEVHVPPGTLDEKIVVVLVQIDWFPLKFPAFGPAFTVTVLVWGADVTDEHPPVPFTL